MKIVLVTDYFRPGNSRVQENHLKELLNRDHDVHLIAGHEAPDELASDLDPRLSAHLYRYDPERPKLLELLAVRRGIRRTWKETTSGESPDLILFNQPLSAWFVQGQMNQSIPQFYVHHAPWHEEWEAHHPQPEGTVGRLCSIPYRRINTVLRHAVERRVLQQCQQIFVLSEFMRDKVINNHETIDRDRVTKIPGGIDPDRFRPADQRGQLRNQYDLPAGDHVILSVRRLVHRMGLDRLIESFGRYLEAEPETDAHLLIVGDGPEKQRLTHLADEHAPDRVRFTGYVSEEDLPDYYKLADLFVLPTRELEGFGLVTVEALASGVPVLATPVGGTREILEPFDPDSFLPDYDPSDWAEAIRRRLDTDPPDESYRRSCREYVTEQFSWEEGIDTILNHYDQDRNTSR